MDAYREVELLAESVRRYGNNPSGLNALDEILLKCRGYMAPAIPPEAYNLGLSQSAARIFNLLYARAGRPVSRDALMDVCVHHPDADTDIKIVDVQVCKLRKALLGTAYEGKIETVYGLGYRLRADTEPKLANIFDAGPRKYVGQIAA